MTQTVAFLFGLTLIYSLVTTLAGFKFNEELFIKNLPESHVNLNFQFTSIWNNKKNQNLNGIMINKLMHSIQINFIFIFKS
jgi:hypothetical protein